MPTNGIPLSKIQPRSVSISSDLSFRSCAGSHRKRKSFSACDLRKMCLVAAFSLRAFPDARYGRHSRTPEIYRTGRPVRRKEKCTRGLGTATEPHFRAFHSCPGLFAPSTSLFHPCLQLAAASVYLAPDDVPHPVHAISLRELKRQTPAAKTWASQANPATIVQLRNRVSQRKSTIREIINIR